MDALCCQAALLLLFLSAGGASAAVDQNWLTSIIVRIKKEYTIPGMQYCVAVNIPEDQKKFKEIFNTDKPDDVKKYGGGDVYKGTNVVAATYKKGEKNWTPFTEHAEARVLDNIEGLAQNKAGHSLIIYSFLSPCNDKCTKKEHKFNILNKIETKVKNKWTDYAFVFTRVFDRTPDNVRITLEDIKEALTNLASAIGQNNIFRCYGRYRAFKCVKCYNKHGKVVEECIKN